MLADRRLSSRGRVLRDDARKVMFLETPDGMAILGYAGLGATEAGTEPSDWMSRVLRGRNLPLEQSLAVLAEALKKQFPQHLLRIGGTAPPAHIVCISSFLEKEPRYYTIDLVFAADRRNCALRYTRQVVKKPGLTNPKTPRIGVAGSGKQYLARGDIKKWMRPLLRIVKAHKHRQVSAHTVADHLASLNNEVHLGDKSVGHRCLVAWRHRKGSAGDGGGDFQFYTGTTRDDSSMDVPIIAHGMDILAIARASMMEQIEAMVTGNSPPQVDDHEINARLARLPDKPDELLR
jgi:hypothetical protein